MWEDRSINDELGFLVQKSEEPKRNFVVISKFDVICCYKTILNFVDLFVAFFTASCLDQEFLIKIKISLFRISYLMLITCLICRKGLPKASFIWFFKSKSLGKIAVLQINFLRFLKLRDSVDLSVKIRSNTCFLQVIEVCDQCVSVNANPFAQQIVPK